MIWCEAKNATLKPVKTNHNLAKTLPPRFKDFSSPRPPPPQLPGLLFYVFVLFGLTDLSDKSLHIARLFDDIMSLLHTLNAVDAPKPYPYQLKIPSFMKFYLTDAKIWLQENHENK